MPALRLDNAPLLGDSQGNANLTDPGYRGLTIRGLFNWNKRKFAVLPGVRALCNTE